jgi:hypothetical protein
MSHTGGDGVLCHGRGLGAAQRGGLAGGVGGAAGVQGGSQGPQRRRGPGETSPNIQGAMRTPLVSERCTNTPHCLAVGKSAAVDLLPVWQHVSMAYLVHSKCMDL